TPARASRAVAGARVAALLRARRVRPQPPLWPAVPRRPRCRRRDPVRPPGVARNGPEFGLPILASTPELPRRPTEYGAGGTHELEPHLQDREGETVRRRARPGPVQ